MRHEFVAVALLSVVLATACSTGGDGPDMFVEEVEPGIVVRTILNPNGDATTILVDEMRNTVLADARLTADGLAWEARVLEPMLAERAQSLAERPTPEVLNVMLVTAWRDVVAEMAAGVKPYDAPGCDGIPNSMESHCFQNCCAEHDRCYALNGCTDASWDWDLEGDQGSACDRCNDDVVGCLGTCALSPPDCNQAQCGCSQSSCFDDSCSDGRSLYCANDCNNPGASPCARGPYPQEFCVNAGGASRFSIHGGAVVACVPWCENTGGGRASGWWWDETLFCCICEKDYNRNDWPWNVMPWPYPIPEIHYRGDAHFGSDCTWDARGGHWSCG